MAVVTILPFSCRALALEKRTKPNGKSKNLFLKENRRKNSKQEPNANIYE